MDQKSIERIIRLFEQSSVAEMELEVDDIKIKLKKTASVVSVASVVPVQTPVSEVKAAPVTDHLWVKAPLVGTYYNAPNPDAKAYVTIGQSVKAGDVVCLIEAMKVMNEIKAHKSGVVTEINAVNGKMVEFNQPILCIGD